MQRDVDIVLVSNRGPMSFVDKGESYAIKRGAGGLAGALHPVARRLGDSVVWIAAVNSETDRAAVAAGAADGLQQELGYPLYLLDVDPPSYSEYYDVVSNRMLWFANHCLFEEIGLDAFEDTETAGWDRSYEPVNRRFSEVVLEVADPSALVLFQDYHLSRAPRHLRHARPDQPILHFTHSSFCGPAGMGHLPRPIYEGVIEGMLGADLVGFHVAQWVDGFLACCEDLGYEVDRPAAAVRHEGRTSWVRDYPIPIDPRSLKRRAQGRKPQSWAERFRSSQRSPVIVRADRIEPSKNIVRGFEAYGRLLDRKPDLQDAVFIACLYPSRQSMDEYKNYAQRIEEVVERVTARHPGSIELFMKDDFDRTLGALMVYDVLLVNPIMDGMNLVAKEGPTLNDNDGVLVLSANAGAFQELGDPAVTIEDPLDVVATSAALERAIEMERPERKRRAEDLRARTTARSARDWIESQLTDLVEIVDGRPPKTAVAET